MNTKYTPPTTDILAKFLDNSRNFHRQMLMECQLSVVSDEILILCPSRDLQEALFLRQNHLRNALLWQNKIKRITILSGDGSLSLPVKSLVIDCRNHMNDTQNQIITVPDSELIYEVLSYPGSASIVRFNDDVGLFSNERIQSTSGTHPNNWIGKNMGSYWITEELNRYKEILLTEKDVFNFRYVAKLFSGENAAFQVQARLVNFRGELARLVKVNSCDILT